MATNLPYEISKFCRHTKQLRHVMRETRSTFQDINRCGNLDGVQLVSAEVTQAEQDEIESITEHPPCIIVLGQTVYAKAFIVNELFNQPLLPITDSDQDLDHITWRMVRLKHGAKLNISLCLPGSYELVDNLAAYSQQWRTIPRQDLELKDEEKKDSAHGVAILEVTLNHPLLKDGAEVVMSAWNAGLEGTVEQVLKKCTEDVLPILIYAIGNDKLSAKDVEDLKEVRSLMPKTPVYFVQVPSPDLTESAQHGTPGLTRRRSSTYSPERHVFSQDRLMSINLFQQLCDVGFLNMVPKDPIPRSRMLTDSIEIESELVERIDNFSSTLLLFVRHVLQSYLIRASTLLNKVHTKCLQNFILTAFDMARDMMITPKRLEFAREKENELYLSLMDIAVEKQDEIKALILDTITNAREDLLQMAADYEFIGVDLPEDCILTSARDLKVCTGQIKELILGRLNSAIAGKLTGSVDVLRDSYTGTLTRCLESLEKVDPEASMNSVSREDYQSTTEALKQILNAAYQVEITVRTSSSLVKLLLEKMKQLVQSMPWSPPPKIDAEWKKSVASDMVDSLSESKLAKSICSQIKDRLKNSHEAFSSALRGLDMRHSGRLEKTEEQRLRVRKIHAPRVARMALESISLRDMIMYGMPQMGREIGRGQYGVVYSCDNWAGYSPCAIKSVVPPDDKHWNDLALEFYYTKNVAEHERLVTIFGSVIDYSYAGGTSPAVLLIMPRLQRDLYSAIKTGLDWPSRLQVAIDVVEGIRFLHSQGLVHRDIKLKNVLLDKRNRGKITDLGFCKPEAMMSGSIVGTPIHMAPELFTGRYDNSVDVYAFGILFWYICAGHVRLPYAFEQCTSKDMLWTSVKRGVRPEKLPHFDDDCWRLMQQCWQGEPNRRPHLGYVEPKIKKILGKAKPRTARTTRPKSNSLTQ